MLGARPGTISPTDQVPGIRLRDFQVDDIARVKELIGLTVTDTRFHHDGRFEPRLVATMYENWVEQPWGRESRHIVVAERGNEVVSVLVSDIGIPVYGLKPEDLAGVQTGFVGLVAVDPRARGSGIAKRLISECTRELFEGGCNVVYANVWLTNEPSANAFLGTGFRVKGSLQEFHIWL